MTTIVHELTMNNKGKKIPFKEIFWKTRALGKTLIDVEFTSGDYSFSDISEVVTFHFNDGTEISVYGDGSGVLIVEED